jgi:DNA primase
VFKFVQEFEKVGFIEAVEALSRRAGIAVPPRQRREAGARTPLLDALEAAAAAYQQWLMDAHTGEAARGYLEGRGITLDTMREFRLGLAPPGWENLVQRLAGRAPDAVLVQCGLAARREGSRGGLYDRFRDRLMVPLVEAGGRVVGFGARAMGDEPPKYLNSPESPVYHKGAFLFGLDRARRAVGPEAELVVVEGYFDAISLHQAGIRHTVATSGTALSAEQARLLRRAAERVVLTYDGDDAGQDATLRSLGILLAEGLDVRVAELRPGEDPDTVVRSGGREAWLALRGQACDPADFVHRHVVRRGGAGDPQERALRVMVRLALQARDPLRVRTLFERADQLFGIRAEVFYRALEQMQKGGSGDPPLAAALRSRREPQLDLERRLLRALLNAPEAWPEVHPRVGPDDFADAEAHALAATLWMRPDVLPEAPLARELLAAAAAGMDWAAEAAGCARQMQRRALLHRKHAHDLELRRTTDPAETQRLLLKNQEIARQLKELSL